MLKKIKPKNSVIALIGVVIIFLGIFVGLYEYFVERKDKAFSEMSIKLYESEYPKNVIHEEQPNEDDGTLENNNQEPEVNESSKDNEYNFLGILEIPKINLKRGFLDINSRYNNVDYNITIINGSTYPDEENNNLILAAHSGNCTVCYFDNLYKLSSGDSAYIYYKGVKYQYNIVDIYEVEKDGTVAIYRDYNKNVLTLITCTRNSDTKQTVYILELVS